LAVLAEPPETGKALFSEIYSGFSDKIIPSLPTTFCVSCDKSFKMLLRPKKFSINILVLRRA
jgi:hypothetical protein